MARQPQRNLAAAASIRFAVVLALTLFAVSLTFVSHRSSAAQMSFVRSVTVSNDDARSFDSGRFVTTETSSMVGTGNGQRANVNGYRFTGIAVPRGAIIDSASFTLVKKTTEWHQVTVDVAFEASDNAASFSSSSPPATRTLTTVVDHVSSDVKWSASKRYALGDSMQLAAALQRVVDRPGWQSGNSVALIAYGDPTPAWSQISFYTFDGGAARAPQLSVTFHIDEPPTNPTATPTATATATPTPTSISTSTPSPTATSTPTPTDTPPTATSTTDPTMTPSPTPTDTGGSPTATSPAGAGDRQILIGPGFSDVSPHQLVRTSGGMLYAVVPTCNGYPTCPGNVLVAYGANQNGTPTSFSALDTAHQPTGGIGSSAIAIDGADQIHVLWNDRSGNVRYAAFDTATNTWGAATTLGATNWTSFGQGNEGVALAVDASGAPHAAWNAAGVDGRLHIQYANRVTGVWSAPAQVDDVPLANNHHAWHPTLAFGPDGRLWLAWLDGSFNYIPDGFIHVRVRDTAGNWAASSAIDDGAMTTIDNGPSLLITGDGVAHITFLNVRDEIRYWYNLGAGWQGDRQPPLQVTHDPSLGPDGQGGVYIYGHGTPHGSMDGHGDNLYRFQRSLASGSWSNWTVYVSGAFDSSVGVRWAQFFNYFPEKVDILYWSDAYPNILYLGAE
jgi:hypothetical protein